MRILVCGGAYRHHKNREAVFKALDELAKCFSITEIHHGGWPGVDAYAEEWANNAGVITLIHPSTPELPTRMQRKERAMRIFKDHRPDLVLVFPGRNWVKDMAKWATQNGLPVVRMDQPIVSQPA